MRAMFSFPAVRMQVVILTDEIKHKLLIQRRDALIDVPRPKTKHICVCDFIYLSHDITCETKVG